MGCVNSTAVSPNTPDVMCGVSHRDDTMQPLTDHEISSRIVGSNKPQCCKLSETLQIEYAFLSQRGYYPDSLDKANQDAYSVVTDFCGDTSSIFFGVFDGHGSTGDLCSIYAREHVPESIKRQVRSNVPFEEAFQNSFTEVNTALHESHIDDSMSGTTAISVVITGTKVYVANVGDSRAIVARRENGKLVARPLSIDQTPFRLDERERVKKSGARVMTLDQLEGLAPLHENWGLNLGEEVDEDGDPPRIWSPNGNYPGTAFTRSIGDEKAEYLGVIAEPEMLSFDLTAADEFVIIASDGVFEFLTSQSVVDMVKVFTNPVQACKAVVAEAYKLWLHYEIRTDDITMICVKVKNTEALTPRSISSQNLLADKSDLMRPVRRNMSKAKQRAQMSKDMTMIVSDEDLAYKVEEHRIPKTDGELEKLKSIVKANVLFRHLSASERMDIFSIMEKIVVKKDDIIIAQGDKGDKFYCVESGDYSVLVRNNTPDGVTEDKVHSYSGKGGTYPSFGELALMHGNPRSSSVIGDNEGVLWAIDCRAFRKIVMKSPVQVLAKTLRQVEILSSLNIHQVHRLADFLSENTFQDGETIIKQGDVGSTFYVIKSGAVVCTIIDPSQPTGTREVLRLKCNQYFGERALLNDEPRAANVLAIGRTEVLQIGRRAFEEVLGSLEDLIQQDRIKREAVSRFDSEVEARRDSKLNMRDMVESAQLRFLCPVSTNALGYLGAYEDPEGVQYTVKAYSKSTVEVSRAETTVVRELEMYRTLKESSILSPSLPVSVGTWQEKNGVHIATNRFMVGDLSSIVADQEISISEKCVKHIAAQALLAIEKLNQHGFVYRNLNPEQLMVDDTGYIQLHDYRYAKHIKKVKTLTLCGTPEYMAPEMISGQGHDGGVDIWALGVLIYELFTGNSPFSLNSSDTGKTADENAFAIYAKISRFESGTLPYSNDIPEKAQDLIAKLIVPAIEERFGCQGHVDVDCGGSIIRSHPWFEDINWVDVAAQTVASPLLSLVQSRFDKVKSVNRSQPEAAIAFQKYTGSGEWCDKF